jgi:hypothetical protein
LNKMTNVKVIKANCKTCLSHVPQHSFSNSKKALERVILSMVPDS